VILLGRQLRTLAPERTGGEGERRAGVDGGRRGDAELPRRTEARADRVSKGEGRTTGEDGAATPGGARGSGHADEPAGEDRPADGRPVGDGESEEPAAPREPGRRPAGGARTVAWLALCLVALPLAVYLASYTPYFANGHTLADFRELHSQMLHFNFTLSAEHSYASSAPTWILDYRPVWYSFREIAARFYGVVAIGNPLLWWTSLLCLVAAAVLALRRRSVTPALAALLVVVLYLPWFATTRTSFLYYMTPVAPFLAILVAAVAAELVDGPRRRRDGTPAGEVVDPSAGPPLAARIAAVAAAGLVAALLWYPLGRLAALLFWELPGRVADALAWVAAGVGVALAVTTALIALNSRRLRPWFVLLLLGAIVGIAVPFLPIVLDVAISKEDFYRLMWFPNWI
ncbi:MAG: hypothetical protein V2J16_10730, partial [Thermoleophilia bacterium]|nr:hypothetical protein [Thermoleophilia bacterium]